MKKLSFVYLVFIANIGLQSQTFSRNPFNDSYYVYQKLAIEHYNKKEYYQAAENYSNAFNANNGSALVTDRYNSAGCWAMAGYPDSSFNQLFKLISARYQKYNDLVLNKDFIPLHNDKRWQEFIQQVKDNRRKYNSQLNFTLVETLDTILQNDQKYRLTEPDIENKYGKNSQELNDLKKLIHLNDSINSVQVQNILNSYGWPDQSIIGDDGSIALFLVIQHSDLKTQEKYLPNVLNASQQNIIPASYLALLEDRIAISKGEKQKYGTQVGTDVNGNYYLEPLFDPKNVDSRRATIGLGPLSEYLKQWNIEWPEKEKH